MLDCAFLQFGLEQFVGKVRNMMTRSQMSVKKFCKIGLKFEFLTEMIMMRNRNDL